jgi:hypothetical protein
VAAGVFPLVTANVLWELLALRAAAQSTVVSREEEFDRAEGW